MLLPPKSHDLAGGAPPEMDPRGQLIELGDLPSFGLGDSPLRPRKSIVISAELHHGFSDLNELVAAMPGFHRAAG